MTTTTRHYTDSSDNPSWIETTKPDGSTETLRYTSSISGDLGASIATDGGVSLMLPNIHDDIATTIPIPAGTPATTAATTIAGWSSYTEYGTPIDPAQTASVGTSAGYGWLGAKERSTTAETANLTLMGVRFYNRITGGFTSVDPVPGGNATSYNYPTDPVNSSDVDGKKGKWKRWAKRAGKWWGKHGGTVVKVAAGVALGACIVASAGLCTAAAVGAAAISVGNNAYKKKTMGKRYSWSRFAADSSADVLFAAVPGLRTASFFKGAHRAKGIFKVSRGKPRAVRRGTPRTVRQNVSRSGREFTRSYGRSWGYRGKLWTGAVATGQAASFYRSSR